MSSSENAETIAFSIFLCFFYDSQVAGVYSVLPFYRVIYDSYLFRLNIKYNNRLQRSPSDGYLSFTTKRSLKSKNGRWCSQRQEEYSART